MEGVQLDNFELEYIIKKDERLRKLKIGAYPFDKIPSYMKNKEP